MKIQHGTKEDAPDAWQLVESSSLDLNSKYFYMIMFSFFSKYSAVARSEDGTLLGFICGFSPEPGTYFCWQVGVSERARGQGLAKRLLQYVTEHGYLRVWASVSPNNLPSNALFESYAKRKNLEVKKEMLFGADLFGSPRHDDEILLRIQ